MIGLTVVIAGIGAGVIWMLWLLVAKLDQALGFYAGIFPLLSKLEEKKIEMQDRTGQLHKLSVEAHLKAAEGVHGVAKEIALQRNLRRNTDPEYRFLADRLKRLEQSFHEGAE